MSLVSITGSGHVVLLLLATLAVMLVTRGLCLRKQRRRDDANSDEVV